MSYSILYSERALKNLKKLDKTTSRLIVAWIEKNLNGCENPRAHGKGLTANLSGVWRYRIGDYRIIAEISESTVTILILQVGHRNDIYK
ncbi:MAG: type II toxin-antitoxin system RelE/ParE family toxin [Clostridiales bacterium]|nr:type II toxin-antitoxin system RelE/ParE family toxin [Clostridiales bacterium]